MGFQQLPGGSARSVSHVLTGTLEYLGDSAVAALHAAGLVSAKEVGAMAAAGQVAVDFEVSDHGLISWSLGCGTVVPHQARYRVFDDLRPAGIMGRGSEPSRYLRRSSLAYLLACSCHKVMASLPS